MGLACGYCYEELNPPYQNNKSKFLAANSVAKAMRFVSNKKKNVQQWTGEPLLDIPVYRDTLREICERFCIADTSLENLYVTLDKLYLGRESVSLSEPLVCDFDISLDEILAKHYVSVLTYAPYSFDTVIADLDQSTSNGSNWASSGFKTKRALINHSEFKEYKDRFLEDFLEKKPVRHLYNGSLKEEVREKGKQPRVFCAGSIESSTIAGRFLDPISDSLNKNNVKLNETWKMDEWYKVGISKVNENWRKMGKRVYSYRYVRSLDITKMDVSVPCVLMERVSRKYVDKFLEIGVKNGYLSEHDRECFHVFLDNNAHQKLIVFSDGSVIDVRDGNPSGWKGTTLYNTIIVMAVVRSLYRKIGGSLFDEKKFSAAVYGDNFMLLLEEDVPLEVIQEHFKQFNLVVKQTAFYCRDFEVDEKNFAEFMSHKFLPVSVSLKSVDRSDFQQGQAVVNVPVPMDPLKRLASIFLVKIREVSLPIQMFQVLAGAHTEGFWSLRVRKVCNELMDHLTVEHSGLLRAHLSARIPDKLVAVRHSDRFKKTSQEQLAGLGGP